MGQMDRRIRMSTPVSLIKKKPMKITLAVLEIQTKKENSAFLAEAMVRIYHQFSASSEHHVRLLNLAFGAQHHVLSPQ